MVSLGGALPLTSLNHVSRVCANVEATKDFYRDVLGFVEIKRPSSFDFEGSWLFNYGVGIHLIEGTPLSRPRDINPKADHLSFQSNALPEVERRLQERGISYVKGSVEEGGVRISQLFFHDPDNNMIEVCNCDCLPVLPLTCQQLGVCQESFAASQLGVCQESFAASQWTESMIAQTGSYPKAASFPAQQVVRSKQ